MNLPSFLTRCKVKIPAVKASGLADADLTNIINEAVVEVNLITKVYRGYTDFNIVNGLSTYPLSQYVPLFQQMVTAGLWVSMNGNPPADLVRVIPRTEEWLNKRLPSWRQALPSTLAQYYYQSADNLQVYPPMNANIVKGARLHHTILPTPMAGNAFPFTGTDVEITALRPLDKAIVEYVRWTLDPALAMVNGEDQGYMRFISFCQTAMKQIKAKPDAINYYDVAVTPST
jgi:hypothetical protein